MTPAALDKRLSALEARRVVVPATPTPEELAEAAHRWEAIINEPLPPDPKRDAYWATVTPKQAAADWDATVKGAPPPWLRGAP